MLDYFPLVKGARREYVKKNSSGAGSCKIEVLDVSTKGPATTARCRRTVTWMSGPETVSEFIVTKDARGVREEEDVEFNHPIQVGTAWISPPRRFWIESLDASTETPAGKFQNCLRVAYLIAEGDGGSGERDYAPGVGLVKIVENDEAEPFLYLLVKKTG